MVGPGGSLDIKVTYRGHEAPLTGVTLMSLGSIVAELHPDDEELDEAENELNQASTNPETIVGNIQSRITEKVFT